MKKLFNRLTALTVALLLAAANIVSASACTAVYAGSDVTDDGSVYYGRSEDFGPSYNKIFEIVPAADHEEGEMLQENWYGEPDFMMPYPAHTLQYSIMRDVRAAWGIEGSDDIPYAEAGINEYGVSMSATVSTYHNDKITAVDPLCWDEDNLPEDFEYFSGISEYAIGTVILQSARTAREGVQILADIVDEYGAAECNAIFIGDSDEVWYFEIVSGHQYAAVRMDPSKVSVVPNMMMMGQIDLNDTENVVASENLIKVAQDAGCYITEDPENPNSIHIAKSYSEGNVAHSTYRAWMGMNLLNPELADTVDPSPVADCESYPNADGKSAEGPFYLQFDPSDELNGKIDLKTMIQVLQARGEGTAYPASEGYYPIANNHQAEDHIFQIRQDLPASIATIHWQAMGPAEFSIFVPFYTAAMSQTPEIYHNESEDFTEDSMYWVFDELAILCNENRDTNVDDAVRAYFSDVQDSLIVQQKTVDAKMQALAASDPEAVTDKAEELANDIAEQVYAIALNTLHELQAYLDSESEEDFVLESTDLPDYKFAAPTGSYKGGSGGGSTSGSSSSASSISVVNTDNGTVTVSRKTASQGSTVTITAAPDEGYAVDDVVVTDASGRELTVTDKGDGKYTFTMPSGAVSVKAVFAAAEEPAAEEICPSAAFTDLSADAWYHEAVDYVLTNSMMNGFADGAFRPNAQLSRAMLAQILYNKEGRPAVSGTAAFSDVAADAWCADAVNWAATNGLVTGYADGRFAPNDNITREQMVAILYRYAQFKGLDAVTLAENLTGFVDEAQISAYAIPALNWAVGQGLMSGKDGSRLAPKDNATRAEVAKVLMNYCEIVAQ